jgi:hypothetical protein
MITCLIPDTSRESSTNWRTKKLISSKISSFVITFSKSNPFATKSSNKRKTTHRYSNLD